MQKRTDTSTMELKERLVFINRVAKVTRAARIYASPPKL